MGSNRKYPFGYGMESGRIKINQPEAKLVRLLFCRYDQGESLAILTDWVRQQGVPYDGDKQWNKNMIARILEDDRYIGKRDYPPIITEEKFYAVAEKRSKRAAPANLTEAQKLLRQKSQKKLTEDAEEQIQFILNWLVLYPSQIITPTTAAIDVTQIASEEADLEELLAKLPVDAEKGRLQTFTLAASRYETIDANQYETERLRRLFRKAQPMTELDAELIRNAISTVHINQDGSVKVELKNQQVIVSRNSTNSI